MGARNRLIVDERAKLARVTVRFDGDDACVRIGPGSSAGTSDWYIRVGHGCLVTIGANVTTTKQCIITAAERSYVSIGEDVMIASECQIRTNDGHAIYDVGTGARVNPSADIEIGDHVWLSWGVFVMGGSRVGDGTVVGARAIVTSDIPNNCVAVGSPARVVRSDVAWERPHLGRSRASRDAGIGVAGGRYWKRTGPRLGA